MDLNNQILLFPADVATSNQFFKRVQAEYCNSGCKSDVILLSKQIDSHKFVFTDECIDRIHVIKEDLYHITKKQTLEMLLQLNEYERCLFPNTVFNGNLSFLGLFLAKQIVIINTWHMDKIVVNRNKILELDLPNQTKAADGYTTDLIDEAKKRLINAKNKIDSINSGQRSDKGFIHGFPAQTERLFGYLCLIEAMRSVGRPKVLEIGCGTGHYAFILSTFSAEYVAYDIDEPIIELSKLIFKKSGLKYVKNKKDIIGKFDFVICFEVIEHLEDPLQFLKTISEYLKPNGTLVISTPNYKKFPWLCFNNKYKNRSDLRDMKQGDLLKMGILRAHVVGLDENWLSSNLNHVDLDLRKIFYTTYLAGINMLKNIFYKKNRKEFSYLWNIMQTSREISINDFTQTHEYIPGFSSYSVFAQLYKSRDLKKEGS